MCIRDRCKAAAAAGNFDISAAEIIDPENYAGFDEMVNTKMCIRDRGITTPETFTKSTPAYFMNKAQTKYIYDILGGEDGQKRCV